VRYVLALDQGTTSSRAILFDEEGNAVQVSQREFRQIYPQPGWVEHDPKEILATQCEVAREAVGRAGIRLKDLTAVGIANQRETTIVWDRQTGEPLYNAIVWQDRRTAPFCERLREAGAESVVRERTGLVIDPYFSGTKIAWLLDHIRAREHVPSAASSLSAPSIAGSSGISPAIARTRPIRRMLRAHCCITSTRGNGIRSC